MSSKQTEVSRCVEDQRRVGSCGSGEVVGKDEAEDVDAFKEFDANNLRAFRVKCLQHARPGQAC
jgi:hypothetical protein